MHISATLWHLIQFNEKLLANVQALETLGGIGEVNGYVRMTLDKLEGIRGDLVRTDDDWLNWKFPELIEALRIWTVRNPLKRDEGLDRSNQRWTNRSKNFQTRQQEHKSRSCVYCDDPSQRSWEKNSGVSTVRALDTRRQIVGVKRYDYDARRNITHRYVRHNQCNKCWLHRVKEK
jgi:hypothetical protein